MAVLIKINYQIRLKFLGFQEGFFVAGFEQRQIVGSSVANNMWIVQFLNQWDTILLFHYYHIYICGTGIVVNALAFHENGR